MASHDELKSHLTNAFAKLPTLCPDLGAIISDTHMDDETREAKLADIQQGIFTKEAMWQADVFPRKVNNGVASGGRIGRYLGEAWNAFPGFSISIESTSFPDPDPAADKIAFEFSFGGTNDGYLPNVGRTRRPVKFGGSGLATFEGAQISFITTVWNCSFVLAQLGVRAHMRADPPLARRVPVSPEV